MLVKDPERAKVVGVKLYWLFKSHEGIFGRTRMPEDRPPQEVARGSYEHRMFVTMTVSIDYMRDANQLWDAGRKTFEDEETRWVYFPSEVKKRSESELVSAMRKHKLSRKYEKDALNIWRPISESWRQHFKLDPIELFKECDYDAYRVYLSMRGRCKRWFPYLSGSKILPLWIRMMHDVVGADFKNLDKIPIPVDVHIARATFTTGCLRGSYRGSISSVWNQIDRVWREACIDTEYYRLQFDEPLWHLSKYGCRERRDDFCPRKAKCPVSEYCVKGKVIVSQDTGLAIHTEI